MRGRYLLDANVCIGLLKGDQVLSRHLALHRPDQVFTCSVVRGELEFAALSSHQVAHNVRIHRAFFDTIVSLPFDDRATVVYGSLRLDLKRSGTPVVGNDMMIAAIALANDCRLVTRNRRQFLQVPGLACESWDD